MTDLSMTADTFASLTKPGQMDLFTPEPPELPRCLYRSTARGVPARAIEFEAWCARYGAFGSITGWGAHAWTVKYAPKDPTAQCRPTALSCDTRREIHRPGRPDRPAPECGCWDIDALQYRGACTGCDWEGEPRTSENTAVEDAHDHAWPGWRDLATVPKMPQGVNYSSDTPRGRSAQKQFEAWVAKLTAAGYRRDWLEAGGPIRTLRQPMGTRHVNRGTPWGGYDLAVLDPDGGEQ